MKKMVFLFCVLIFLFSFLNIVFARKGSYVKGYYRKNGTYVRPHYRRGTFSSSKSSKVYKLKSSNNYTTYKYLEKSSKYLINSEIKVVDGDTFYYKNKMYRISGIDTPEKGQYNCEQAKIRLETLLKYGNVEIEEITKDEYGRNVVKVWVNGENISDILKREGSQKLK